MTDFEIERWIEKNVPKKDTLSRDAVEILIKLAWKEAMESGVRGYKAHLEYEKHGDPY